jgi:hypothetical protein
MKFSFDEFQALQKQVAANSASKAELDENQRESFEERAAILEFCCNMQRKEAERMALDMILNTT